MLQSMLSVCISVCDSLDVLFNHKKSFCIAIGRDYHSGFACLDLSGHKFQWVNSVKYLGVPVVIVSGPTFSISIDQCHRKFYSALNAINYRSKFASEPVKMQLFEAYGLPVLAYGLDSAILSKKQISELNVCWNKHLDTMTTFRDI